jgi:chaperone required for assembly of F1-ATPase
VIAHALARQRISAEVGWAAAHVDEDWQMSQWGEDDQALTRRARRWREMKAAATILAAG